MTARRQSIRCQIGSGGPIVIVFGREAWALLQLIAAGERGVTPIDRPAPRWSAYVHDLRRLGIAIETVHEPHGGPFAGTHARYVLRSPVNVLEATEALAA